MKTITALACALLLFSGAASAQATLLNGVLGKLLGPEGVVASLLVSLQKFDLQPTIDALIQRSPDVSAPVTQFGETPLLQGSGAQSLNKILSALLTDNTGHFLDLGTTLEGVSELLISGPANGLLGGLLGSLAGFGNVFGGGALFGGLLGGGVLTASGQGMSPDQIPLDDISPSAHAALVNGISLPGL